MKIKTVALIGLGAIGSVYGKLLYEKYGDNFAVVAGGARGERLKSNGIKLNEISYYPQVISPEDTHFKANLIIFCVKNYQLDEAILDVSNLVTENTIMLPLLNGVTSRDRILSHYANNTVFYGLAMAIDAVRTSDGVVNTLDGVIQFGNEDNTVPTHEVLSVQKFLSNANISNQVFDDMKRTLWKKWMLNVGCNQVSAIMGTNYSKLVMKEIYSMVYDAMLEVVALAKAKNIGLTEQDALEVEGIMKTMSPEGKTSMLQDIEGKRKTEVDYFAGTVIAIGKELNIDTPLNKAFYRIIKAKEKLY